VSLITPVAGRYSSTLDPPGATGATDLGIAEEGYRLRIAHALENVDNTDAYADQVVEQIYRGLRRVGLAYRSKEYKTGPLLAFSPQAAFGPTGAQTFAPGVVGRLATALAGVVVMTATPNTPAAASPATMTFTSAIIREDFDVELLFGPTNRLVPLDFRILPYDSGSGVPAYFTAT
jgi:hypothetical protein